MSEPRQTLAWVEQVTNNITEVFWLTNVEKTEILYISPGYERVWGRSASPRSWIESLHPDDREWVRERAFTQQALGGYDVEYRILRPNNEIVWIHDRAFPVRDESGCVCRVAGIAEDVSERKRAEMLLHAQRDLGITLSLTNDLQFALESLLKVATSVEGIDSGGVYLVDPKNGSLSLIAHYGLSTEFVESVCAYPAGSVPSRIVAAGEPIYSIHRLLEDFKEPALLNEKLQGVAILPLVHEEVVLGSLNLASHTKAKPGCAPSPRMRRSFSWRVTGLESSLSRMARD
jgi:PAS domain S-box-containing protein